MPKNVIHGWSSLEDIKAMAKAYLPGPIFDYVSSGSGDQNTARENSTAFGDYRFVPRVGVNVSTVDTKTQLFGVDVSMPLAIAPMGGMGMIHAEAELALARAASKAGILFGLSAYSSLSMEQIADACPGPKMFQLYLMSDRGLTNELISIAKEKGFNGLAVTMDVAAQPDREPVSRWNSFGLEGGIPMSTKIEVARHTAWLRNQKALGGVLTDVERRVRAKGGAVGPDFYVTLNRNDFTWVDVAAVAKAWNGPLAAKGVLCADDAKRAVDAGATTIIICNHGGIALDDVAATLSMVEEIVAAVGDKIDVIQSSGLRRGGGIAKALALGAKACMTGRPFAYGAAAGMESGVSHVIELFRRELQDAMKLCGAADTAAAKDIELRIKAAS